MRLLAVCSISALSVATAAYPQGTAEQRRACTRDAVTLCFDAIPDTRRVSECLHDNRERLSRSCAASFRRGIL
ncbi:hypothetical protein RPMA_19085 [Tardiphaga alba]|uniref:Cysteine rich repeat-containing protein n=1 Tax=Tardiphaga alba TaxID=340268 RepID=A0ABX8AFX6_9BRAD|nr:hypothetical protein RPMA_19085 [Tardiphaga alba]